MKMNPTDSPTFTTITCEDCGYRAEVQCVSTTGDRLACLCLQCVGRTMLDSTRVFLRAVVALRAQTEGRVFGIGASVPFSFLSDCSPIFSS